jgi:hypothetical protein
MALRASHLAARCLTGVALVVLLSAAIALAANGSGDPKKAFTKQDQRWAKSVLLPRADLPTGVAWNAYSTGGSGGGGGGGTTPGCPGVRTNDSDLTETGEALSPFFITTNRQFIIVSAAWIYKTSGQAKAFVQRLEHAITHCGAAALKSEVGATKSARLLSYGQHPIPGTRPWWNYRIVVSIHAQGRTLKSFVDSGFGQRGRATAWLILHGAYAPIPASVEADLVHVVMARMGKPPR